MAYKVLLVGESRPRDVTVVPGTWPDSSSLLAVMRAEQRRARRLELDVAVVGFDLDLLRAYVLDDDEDLIST